MAAFGVRHSVLNYSLLYFSVPRSYVIRRNSYSIKHSVPLLVVNLCIIVGAIPYYASQTSLPSYCSGSDSCAIIHK